MLQCMDSQKHLFTLLFLLYIVTGSVAIDNWQWKEEKSLYFQLFWFKQCETGSFRFFGNFFFSLKKYKITAGLLNGTRNVWFRCTIGLYYLRTEKIETLRNANRDSWKSKNSKTKSKQKVCKTMANLFLLYFKANPTTLKLNWHLYCNFFNKNIGHSFCNRHNIILWH